MSVKDEKVPKTIEHELTMLYLSKKDFSDMTPEKFKQQYFEIFHRIEAANAERWE